MPSKRPRPSRSPSRAPRKQAEAPVERYGPMGATRPQIVWVSFLAAMTIVGGLLLVLDNKPVPRSDGYTPNPLAYTTTIGNVAAVDPMTPTRVPLDKARWQAIVIHDSGSPVGNVASISKQDEARGIKGLGHHFIIGNGTGGMDDGQVHVGFRWLDQKPGAHAAGANGDWYNLHAISICLVGDGERVPFTHAQIQQLNILVTSLRKQLDLPADRVFLYSDIMPSSRDPGPLFPRSECAFLTDAQTQ